MHFNTLEIEFKSMRAHSEEHVQAHKETKKSSPVESNSL